LLHSTRGPEPDQCHSYRLVAAAAALKQRFPHQVHILLGNHAMAQVSRDEVLKNGQPMVRALNTGVSLAFADRAGLVMHALDEFLLSLPVAARGPNRIWMSHSLPSSRHLQDFDDFIFEKIFTVDDMKQNASLRALTWDRSHDEVCLERLRRMWEVDIFIVGHQPQETGVKQVCECLIILASDHAQGRFLPFRLDRHYHPAELLAQVKPLAEIDLSR